MIFNFWWLLVNDLPQAIKVIRLDLVKIAKILKMDICYYPREYFAPLIINRLSNNWLRRVTIFAPRKHHKNRFIKQEVMPLFLDTGILPIYVDFAMGKKDPESMFIKSVMSACEKNESLLNKMGKFLAFKNSGVGAGGQQIEPGVTGADNKNADLFAALKRLNELCTPVVVILDEIQHLASEKEFKSFTEALRSFAVNREDVTVKYIFIGSSCEGMNRLFRDNDAPFYNSSKTADSEELSIELIESGSDGYDVRTLYRGETFQRSRWVV